MEKYSFSAPADAGRIDALIADMLEDVSRSRAQQLIEQGLVTLDGEPVDSKKKKPAAKALIEVTLPDPEPLDVLPEDIPLDIAYEDEDVIVVNKPRGMVVHPAPGNLTGTLVNALLYHCAGSLSSINGVERPGIVHRIDRDTTGSLLVCKNDTAHRSIAQQLQEHTIVRRYFAIVYDNIAEDEIMIDKAIGRDTRDRKKMMIRPDGKRAVTHCKVLERFGRYTYVECRLETGRTHQIRVHMSSINHPVLGDEVYGGRHISPYRTQGQCLHASVLGFLHPVTGAYIETHAPLPDYFVQILDLLREKK